MANLLQNPTVLGLTFIGLVLFLYLTIELRVLASASGRNDRRGVRRSSAAIAAIVGVAITASIWVVIGMGQLQDQQEIMRMHEITHKTHSQVLPATPPEPTILSRFAPPNGDFRSFRDPQTARGLKK